MKARKLLLMTTLAAMVGCVWAQGPNSSGTYYQSANGKKGAALKTALCGIIHPHTNLGYDGLYDAYKQTDTRPDGYVRDWYSNATYYRHVTDKAGQYSNEGDCYNREHTVPQSWFGGGEIKSDVVHVVPADGKINGMRSNNPFGEVSRIDGQSKNGYSKWGSCRTAGYSGTVFEPNDEIKGDIARIYFYMATCYESQAPGWGHSVFTGTTYNPFSTWTYDMLLRWAQQDPVDAVETARNNAVYATQHNRNPFVDYPGLENYIWGDKKDLQFSYDNYEGGGSGVATVAMPVFSPDEGTYSDQVEVTLTCSTPDADIYYTTGGADASSSSILYDGPFTLSETTTVKAVAIKDGVSSYQALATYTIRQSGGGETPADCTIALNNTFFDCASGTINKNVSDDFVGSQQGVTVTYALGTGNQRYATSSEIRVYTGNKLTVSVSQGMFEEIEFTIGKKNSALKADKGTMSGFKWTGKANQVVFESADNTAIVSMTVKMAEADGVATPVATLTAGRRVVYNLQGQQVASPTRGLYIVDGKKVYIK